MKDKVPINLAFTAPLESAKTQLLICLPEDESRELPSRGQVYVTGHLDDCEFAAVLEPDGRWGHWLRVTPDLQHALGAKPGDHVNVRLTTSDAWPEPVLPQDVADALANAPQKVKDKWQDITPMARWEWVRWVNATGSPATRATRIVKTLSKLDGTHRRPCCFNLAACTDPELSRAGRLIELSS